MHSGEEYMQFCLRARQKRGSLGRLKMLTRIWKSSACWWHLFCSVFCFLTASLAHLFVLHLFHMSGCWSSMALHVNAPRSAGLTGSSPLESLTFGHTKNMTFSIPVCYPDQITTASNKKNHTCSIMHFITKRSAKMSFYLMSRSQDSFTFFFKPVASGQRIRLLTRHLGLFKSHCRTLLLLLGSRKEGISWVITMVHNHAYR